MAREVSASVRALSKQLRNTRGKRIESIYMIPASYKPRRKFMELAVLEAKRAGDRGDYPIGAVITRRMGSREVVIASAGNRVKTSGSSIKHVELETLKYVSSGVWSRIGAVVYGVSQEDIAAYGRKCGTEDYKWRACLISCKFVFEKGNHHIPVTGGFLRQECQKLFSYKPAMVPPRARGRHRQNVTSTIDTSS
jgi:tRNA(Arg) A34 adenosine deaminase TadA